jgi:hypothetical protein
MTNLASDTFTGANNAAFSSTWTTGATPTGGSTTIQSNRGRFLTGNNAGTYQGNNRISRLVNITAPVDAVALFSFIYNAAPHSYPRFYIRSANTTLDGMGGYYFEIDPDNNQYSMGVGVSYTNTTFPTNTSSDLIPMTWVSGTKYWVRFGVVGSAVKMRLWLDGNAEPNTWDKVATDTTVTTASSGCGFTVGAGATSGGAETWDVDDFSLDTTFPTLSGTVSGNLSLSGTVTAQNIRPAGVSGNLSLAGTVTARNIRSAGTTGNLSLSSTVTAQAVQGVGLTGNLSLTGIVSATAQAPTTTGVLGNLSLTGTVTAVTGFYFRTPSYREHPDVWHPLIRRTYLDVGYSLLKTNGSYKMYRDVDPDLMDLADQVYLGGHIYFIDPNEAQDLRNAGYGIYVTGDLSDPIPDIDLSQYGTGVYGTGPYGD